MAHVGPGGNCLQSLQSSTRALLCLVGSMGVALIPVAATVSWWPFPAGCGGADGLHAPAELAGGLRMAAHLCAANARTQDYQVTGMVTVMAAVVLPICGSSL